MSDDTILINLSDDDSGASKRDLTKHLDDRSITFDKSIEAIQFINQKFRHAFPWMYMFTLYKKEGQRILFNWMRSIPFYDIARSHSDANSVIFEGRWSGDNVDDFYIQSRREVESKRKDEDLKLGKAKDWEVVKKHKCKYHKLGSLSSNFSGEYYDETEGKPKKYASRMVMALNSISYIYVYNWGFEIQTDSPLDVVCVKRKSLVENALNNVSTQTFNNVLLAAGGIHQLNNLESNILQEIISKNNFTLPSEICNVKMLRGFWSSEERKEKAKETDEWLLGEYGKTEPEINVGQEVNQNIIF